QLVRQDLRVDAVLPGKAVGVDGVQPGEPLADPAGGLRVVRRRPHGQPVIVAVLALLGRPFRPALQAAIHDCPGQRAERAVRIVCHDPNLNAPPPGPLAGPAWSPAPGTSCGSPGRARWRTPPSRPPHVTSAGRRVSIW